MKFNRQNKDLLGIMYYTGSMYFLPPTTVLRHVVVNRLSHQQHFSRNVVQTLAQEGRNTTSGKPAGSSLRLGQGIYIYIFISDSKIKNPFICIHILTHETIAKCHHHLFVNKRYCTIILEFCLKCKTPN